MYLQFPIAIQREIAQSNYIHLSVDWNDRNRFPAFLIWSFRYMLVPGMLWGRRGGWSGHNIITQTVWFECLAIYIYSNIYYFKRCQSAIEPVSHSKFQKIKLTTSTRTCLLHFTTFIEFKQPKGSPLSDVPMFRNSFSTRVTCLQSKEMRLWDNNRDHRVRIIHWRELRNAAAAKGQTVGTPVPLWSLVVVTR
jgi:hypothetical protein